MLFAPLAPYTLTVGARHENNETFGDFLTYRAAGSVQLAPSTRVRASVGTAFREPTFLQSYGGAFAIGNPALKPEHAVSVDAGVEQGIGDWARVGVTYFASSFRDLIDYKYSAKEPNYFNVARTRTAGVEVEARATLPEGWSADAAFTYLSTRVADPGTSTVATAIFAPGARLLRRPMHTMQGAVSYRRARGGAELRAHRSGRREDTYFAPNFTSARVTLPAYVRADLSGELSLFADPRRAVHMTLRAENLFDARYTDVAGFNHDFALTDPASLARTGYRAAGRRILTGLKVSVH